MKQVSVRRGSPAFLFLAPKGYSFRFSSNTNISKFQFDLHSLLASSAGHPGGGLPLVPPPPQGILGSPARACTFIHSRSWELLSVSWLNKSLNLLLFTNRLPRSMFHGQMQHTPAGKHIYTCALDSNVGQAWITLPEEALKKLKWYFFEILVNEDKNSMLETAVLN